MGRCFSAKTGGGRAGHSRWRRAHHLPGLSHLRQSAHCDGRPGTLLGGDSLPRVPPNNAHQVDAHTRSRGAQRHRIRTGTFVAAGPAAADRTGDPARLQLCAIEKFADAHAHPRRMEQCGADCSLCADRLWRECVRDAQQRGMKSLHEQNWQKQTEVWTDGMLAEVFEYGAAEMAAESVAYSTMFRVNGGRGRVQQADCTESWYFQCVPGRSIKDKKYNLQCSVCVIGVCPTELHLSTRYCITSAVAGNIGWEYESHANCCKTRQKLISFGLDVLSYGKQF